MPADAYAVFLRRRALDLLGLHFTVSRPGERAVQILPMKFRLPLVSTLRRITSYLERAWLRIALLITVAFLVHLPSLPGQLVSDGVFYLVGENPFFRSPIFSLEVFRHYLSLDSQASSHYRAEQNLSYMLDYLVLERRPPYGYHFSNILWHAGAVVLLFFCLRRVLPTCWGPKKHTLGVRQGSFLIALLWAVHPVHSAAIDYVSGRADSLAFAFSCGAWLTYMQAPESRRRGPQIPALCGGRLLLLLGLLARVEMACIWAVVFLVHLSFFTKDRSRRHLAAAAVDAC